MAIQKIGTHEVPGNTYEDPGIYYDKRFLLRLKPQLCFDQLGDKRPLPTKSGTLIRWFRAQELAAVTSPLTEGENPEGQTISTVMVSAEPKTYGSYISVSSELNLKSINPIIEEITDMLADQAALTYDTIIFNALHTNLKNYYCGGKTSEAEIESTDVFNAAELRRIVYELRKSNVIGYEGNMYKLVIHPAVQFDLLSDSAVGGFIDLNKYQRPEQIDKGEIGQMWGARIILSNNLPTGEGNECVTYRSFLVAPHAYGISELAGHGIKTIRQAPGGVSDPLEMKSTVGWKFIMASAVLDSRRAIEVYSASAVS